MSYIIKNKRGIPYNGIGAACLLDQQGWFTSCGWSVFQSIEEAQEKLLIDIPKFLKQEYDYILSVYVKSENETFKKEATENLNKAYSRALKKFKDCYITKY